MRRLWPFDFETLLRRTSIFCGKWWITFWIYRSRWLPRWAHIIVACIVCGIISTLCTYPSQSKPSSRWTGGLRCTSTDTSTMYNNCFIPPRIEFVDNISLHALPPQRLGHEEPWHRALIEQILCLVEKLSDDQLLLWWAADCLKLPRVCYLKTFVSKSDAQCCYIWITIPFLWWRAWGQSRRLLV